MKMHNIVMTIPAYEPAAELEPFIRALRSEFRHVLVVNSTVQPVKATLRLPFAIDGKNELSVDLAPLEHLISHARRQDVFSD